MGFGAELKDFAKGFRTGVQVANQSRDSETNKYRYGRPPKGEVESMPGLITGTGTVGTKDPSSDPGATSSTGAKVENRGGGPFVQQAYNYYRQRGLSHQAAAGIAGNLMQESGGAADVLGGTRRGDAGASAFAAQWQGPRLKNLMSFVKSRGRDHPTLQDQFDFVLEEMNPESPYVDDQAAKMFPSLQAAKTVEEATSLFRQHFERPSADDLGSRTKYALQAADPGGTQTASFSFDNVGTGAIPDEDEDEDDGGPAPSEPVEEEEGTGEVGSASLSFDLPDVAIPEVTPWTEYAQLAARPPAMFAAKGGVIPEMNYAEGGQVEEPAMAPRPAVDPYNSTRSYTQQIPESGARPTFQPRRISAPVMPDRTAAGARTTSQQAWDAAKSKAAADKAAAAAAAAAAQPAAAAAPVGYTDAEMRRFRQMQMLGIPLKEGTWKDVSAKATPQQYTDLKMMGYGSGSIGKNGLFGQGGLRRGGSREQGGMVYHNFAKGGVVPSISQEYWEEAVAREERRPRYGASAGESARDIAAKRINRQSRGVTSSAMPTGGSREKVAPAGGKHSIVRKKSGDSTSSIEPKLPKESVGGGKESKPGTKVTPDTATPPQPKPGRLSDEYTPPRVIPEQRTKDDAVVPEEYELPGEGWLSDLIEDWQNAPEQAQGGVESPIPGVAAPVSAEQDQPRGGRWDIPGPGRPAPAVTPSAAPAIPETPVPPAPPAVPGPGGLPGGGPGAPRLDLDAVKQMAVEAVENGSEAAMQKLQEIYEGLKARVPGPVDRPPLLTIQEPEAATGNGFLEIVPTFDDFLGMILGDAGPPPLRESGTPPPPEPGPPTDRQGRPVRQIAFAAGGAVPEEDEPRAPLSPRLAEAGYTTSATGERSSARQPAAPAPAPDGQSEEAPKQRANVKPTKRLRDDVAKAADAGVRGLTRLLGLGGEGGAMPSPGDEPIQREGATRLARGEGAATPEEISGIDDAIDPNRELDEGYRQMNRLAQTVQWYQQAGRKDDAEAAAAGLLQYGSQRFAKLGSMAANQYEKFQQTGDQDYLQGTINMLEQAYAMVPDGANVDVSINSQTGDLQITHIDADGNEEDIPVSARDLPGIIQSVQDGSQYWKSVYRLADPQGAKEEATERRQAARDERTAKRQEEHDLRLAGFTQDREDRRYSEQSKRDEKLEKWKRKREEAKDARDAAEMRRRYPNMNWDVVSPLHVDAKAKLRAIEDADDPEAAQQALNESASRLFQAVAAGSRDPAGMMADLGVDMELFDMVNVTPGEAPATEQPRQAPDGKWYKMGPNGKYIEVEPTGG